MIPIKNRHFFLILISFFTCIAGKASPATVLNFGNRLHDYLTAIGLGTTLAAGAGIGFSVALKRAYSDMQKKKRIWQTSLADDDHKSYISARKKMRIISSAAIAVGAVYTGSMTAIAKNVISTNRKRKKEIESAARTKALANAALVGDGAPLLTARQTTAAQSKTLLHLSPEAQLKIINEISENNPFNARSAWYTHEVDNTFKKSLSTLLINPRIAPEIKRAIQEKFFLRLDGRFPNIKLKTYFYLPRDGNNYTPEDMEVSSLTPEQYAFYDNYLLHTSLEKILVNQREMQYIVHYARHLRYRLHHYENSEATPGEDSEMQLLLTYQEHCYAVLKNLLLMTPSPMVDPVDAQISINFIKYIQTNLYGIFPPHAANNHVLEFKPIINHPPAHEPRYRDRTHFLTTHEIKLIGTILKDCTRNNYEAFSALISTLLIDQYKYSNNAIQSVGRTIYVNAIELLTQLISSGTPEQKLFAGQTLLSIGESKCSLTQPQNEKLDKLLVTSGCINPSLLQKTLYCLRDRMHFRNVSRTRDLINKLVSYYELPPFQIADPEGSTANPLYLQIILDQLNLHLHTNVLPLITEEFIQRWNELNSRWSADRSAWAEACFRTARGEPFTEAPSAEAPLIEPVD